MKSLSLSDLSFLISKVGGRPVDPKNDDSHQANFQRFPGTHFVWVMMYYVLEAFLHCYCSWAKLNIYHKDMHTTTV